MSTFSPVDTEYAAAQINALKEAGADIVRVAVPDRKAAEALGELRSRVTVPLVADIHFDYRLALTAMESGIDALRINPGNIGRRENVVKVVDMAKEKHIPIRIGINAGSLPAEILERFGGHPTAEGMVEGALNHVKILEEEDFHDIVISVKSTDVPMMVKANRLLHEKVDYPLHLGVTEAGTLYRGTIKSAIGIGALLLDGIGDTIRVSLTDDPVKEVKAAKEILSAAGMQQYGPVLVSCPTCGRTQVNLIEMAQEVEKKIEHFKKPIRVAVMGCAVNGPGEAREADFGIAGGKGSGLLFRKGKVIRSVPETELIDALMEEIETFENEGE
jgi:(E)-4-hydroxy-3-methylbut-2-enyl-diphosphate synthase